MNTLLWKIAKPIVLALVLVFGWVVILAVILMGCGESRGAEAKETRTLVFGDYVYFDDNSYAIRDDQKPVLTRLAEVLRANPTCRVTIEGHCDERGTPEYNRVLGQRRADAIRRLLVEKGKIAPERVKAISLGNERPENPGRDQKALSRNRRVTFVLTEPSDRPETSRR